jgi:ABC-type polysaccharide/polyol phosphate export permease
LFLSPIFWPVSAASERAAFILYNPFAHLLEVVRSPLLGDPPAMLSVIICVVMAVVGFAFAALIHGGVRRRIVFWL